MTYQFPPDVERLVKEHMLVGGYTSEDDVLREALKALSEFVHSREAATDEYQQAVAAVREGVDDMHAGRMTSLRSLIDQSSDTSVERT